MKTYLLILVSVLMLLFSGCSKDFLDRLPESDISPQLYFNTENDLIVYTNSFYDDLPGTSIYGADNESDNIEPSAISLLMSGKRTVPGSASDAGWTWQSLRNVNFFLENYQKAAVSQEIKDQYAGLARFFRAWFYFKKVQRFGDVPWYSSSLNVNSPELYKARDPRVLVVDSIRADLDFAIAHLGAEKNISRINKWTALALKSRVCLFEGTFRKYHDELNLISTAEALLQEAQEAAAQIMQSGLYKLYSTGQPTQDYQNLFTAESANTDEIILAEVYDASFNKTHTANGAYTSPTLGNPGFTKSFVNSYLMKDGSSFTNRPDADKMVFSEEVKDRDPRLAQTLRTPGYKRTGTNTVLNPDFTNALTGYQCIKYVTGVNQDGYNSNTNDLPVFRYAEVLLNYAEAKAELGSFTQSDADLSINLLRARVGMAPMQVGALVTDAYQRSLYAHDVSNLIVELRRERRVELAMEGFRYHDIMRWKEGHLLAETFQGMYFPGKGTFDLDGNGNDDFALVDEKPANPIAGIQYYILGNDKALSEGNSGNLIVHPTTVKVFDENKDYLYPLPSSELTLNENLVQNPNW
uniref:RagB/SusD domain-containing protein n=1 Tax=Sphingobacterium sp. (strain 21) TaxID=743722 RepID=F4CBG8_SPHS2